MDYCTMLSSAITKYSLFSSDCQ
uniref:Uncharacterized protein n=1 Tax=Arundo donax TaxID=35708 RepID=A0A0A9I0T2_ARUDO